MKFTRALGQSFSALLACVACSFIDPQAGAPQAACGIDTGAASQNGQPAGYYGMSSGQGLGAATCATSSQSVCNACESAHCCATRSACYGDPVCACADLTLDQCLEAAATVALADAPAALSRCWDQFSARGTVEAARVACQRSWCRAECALP